MEKGSTLLFEMRKNHVLFTVTNCITCSVLKQTQEHTLLVWALVFFLVENIDESNLEANFTSTVLQTALNQLLQTNITSIHNAVLKVKQR